MALLRPLGQVPQSRGWSALHPAIDWPAPTGTPVRAAETGIVVAAGPDSLLPFGRDRSAGGGGILVTIDHGRGVQTVYAHLSAVAVRLGQQVAKGAPIGFVGATGRATGPHLHFMLWRNGSAVDPAPYLEGGGRELPIGGGATMPDDQPVKIKRSPTGSYPSHKDDPTGSCPIGYSPDQTFDIGNLLADHCYRVGTPGTGFWPWEGGGPIADPQQQAEELMEGLEGALINVAIVVGLIVLAIIGLKLLVR